MLEQVASIDEDKRGLYIREHGLYQSDIDTWKTEVLCVAEQVQQVLKDAENRHQEELVAQKAFYEKEMQKVLSTQNASSEANTLLQQELAQCKTAFNSCATPAPSWHNNRSLTLSSSSVRLACWAISLSLYKYECW